MLILYMLVEVIMVLIGVAFVTVLERKILGMIQIRLGPNKILVKGVLQSLADALKLMSKYGVKFFFSSLIEYNIMPMGMLFMMLILWLIVSNALYDFNHNLLMILCIMSVGIYPIMLGSWFSGSLYSMIGSIRSIAQMISYEVSLIIIIMSLVVFTKSFNLNSFMGVWYMMGFMWLFMIMFMLFISILMELGRTPSDLLEGESELVSGFNTEFSGFKFAMIFLAEYGMIMFLSGLISSLGLGLMFFSIKWMFFTMLFIILIIWIRGILPRIRYDKLMTLCWISMLNLSLGVLIMHIGIVVMI